MFPFAAKQARLKQAKEEAEKEIAAFRAHMEAEYQKKLAQVCRKLIIKFIYNRTTQLNFLDKIN